MSFKILIPEQLVLKHRSLSLSPDASLFADLISVEEGWGTQNNGQGCVSFGACRKAILVCRPEGVNHYGFKFNK